jgi:phosphatidylethanolamine/phosphatidyl-N-methylethanolamine N-methyltransferase
MVASKVARQDGEYVVELGSGTGAVTRALLEAGVPASKLIAVEIDSELAAYLAEVRPDITVIHGSAVDIDTLLPAEAVDRVGTVICGVPVSMLGEEEQAAMVRSMLALKPHNGQFLAYSYRLCAPLHASARGLKAERLGFTLRNAFPASVWSFRAADGGPESADS